MERDCPACGQSVQAARMGVVDCPSCAQAVFVTGSGEDAPWEDRRAFTRYGTSHRVLVRSCNVQDGTATPFRVARLHNLSGGGARVEASELPATGSRLDMVLAAGRARLLNLQACVRHRGQMPDGTQTAGLEFLDITLPEQHCVIATARRLGREKNVS